MQGFLSLISPKKSKIVMEIMYQIKKINALIYRDFGLLKVAPTVILMVFRTVKTNVPTMQVQKKPRVAPTRTMTASMTKTMLVRNKRDSPNLMVALIPIMTACQTVKMIAQPNQEAKNLAVAQIRIKTV